jgi:spore coat polysaccharide biosynthesis protein SpsF
MSRQYQTEQEFFWAGEFGKEYINRNKSQEMLAGNIKLFAEILSKTNKVQSIIEFGANIGLNLEALKILLPQAKLSAIEINEEAAKKLQTLRLQDLYVDSILRVKPKTQYDFALIKTVLIHINPDSLSEAYEALYQTSRKYICLVEYYSPQPVMINYRGHQNKLFKRDFCGEMMDRYPDLRLVDYGFTYHRDNSFLMDDQNWFLLEKMAE